MAAGVTRNTDFRCALCTGDYGLDLCLLGLGHGELVKGLLKIIEKGLPLGALKNGKLYLAVMGDAEIAARALQAAQTPKFSDEL